VSSILEALRELEGERPPAARRDIPPAEAPPSVARRAAGAFIPILGGLAVGVVAFAFYAWGPVLVSPRATPDTARPPDAATGDTPTADRPSWLDTAEAPRARVNRGPTAAAPSATAPAPRRAESAPSQAAAAPAPAPEPTDESDQPRQTSGGGQVAVESVSYSANPAARVATIRIHGRRVTFREHESVDGIEVQLIMPGGVYVRRGNEVYLLPVNR
jgi:hypothetical protein